MDVNFLATTRWREIVAAIVGLIVFTCAAAASPSAPAPTVYVESRDNLNGFDGNELSQFLARTMSQAGAGPFTFSASSADRSSPDRVVWSFVPGAEAAGSVRTYGFSRAMMERLVGSNRVYTIEARLYLGGQYEALVTGQFRETEEPQNPELVEEVRTISRTLMSLPSVIDKASKPDPDARSPHNTM